MRKESVFSKIVVGCSGLSKSILLYRMGKDPHAALETRDVTDQVHVSVIEQLLSKEGKQVTKELRHDTMGACRFTLQLKIESIIDQGTLIQATMRPQDLLPVFYKELYRLHPSKAVVTVNKHLCDEDQQLVDLITAIIKGEWPEDSDDVWDRFEVREVIDCLSYELDQLANQHGMYFGTTEGDGSDYGFWPNPVEEGE